MLFRSISLSSLGIDIAPLLAGAGVIGVAIGFGTQTLVRDIVAGIFYLLADAFRVGEYVEFEIGCEVKLPLAGKFVGEMSLPTRTTDVAFSVVQLRVTALPDAGEKIGSEVKDRILTLPTLTVVLAWIWPVALVAVNV